MKKPIKQKSYSQRLSIARKRLWKKISEYARMRYAQGDLVQCVTCGEWVNWKYECDAGHFVPQGSCSELMYDLRNIHAQCKPCNCHYDKERAKIAYTLFMQKTYGHDLVEDFSRVMRSQSYKKWNLAEIEELEKDIDARIEGLNNLAL